MNLFTDELDEQHISIKLTPDQLRSLADMGVAIIITRADALKWETNPT